MVITPITAKIHYDDLSKLWHMKVAREEASSPSDIKPYVEFIGDFLNLVLLVQALLDFFATAGTSVNATIGDLTTLASWATAHAGGLTEDVVTVVPGDPAFPGSDFDSPPYDGTTDLWGVTEDTIGP